MLHEYIDKTLNLQESLRISMEGMTTDQFERVLHPIFEEDELTLIIAGAILGLVAGLIQQGLETGVIKLPNLKQIVQWMKRFPSLMRNVPRKVCTSASCLMNRLRGKTPTATARADENASSPSEEETGADNVYPPDEPVGDAIPSSI